MDFRSNPEETAIFEEFAAFGRANVAPRALACARENVFDKASWAQLAETAIWQYAREDAWKFTRALEGLASTACDGGFIMAVIAQGTFMRTLAQSGNAAQQQKWMPALQNGMLNLVAIAEPQSGTDVPGILTEVVEKEGKFFLSGEKFNIAMAPEAEIGLVLAYTPFSGERRISLLLLEMDRNGMIRGERDEKMGNRTMPTGSLKFDRVEVSASDVLGNPGKGVKELVQGNALARAWYALAGSWLVEPVLNDTKSFLKDRKSFGAELLSQQYVQGKITDILLRRQESKYLAYGAIQAVLDGHPDGISLASMAKISGVRAFAENVQALVELNGSRGYQLGFASHLLADALGWYAVAGTEEMHRMGIFRQWL